MAIRLLLTASARRRILNLRSAMKVIPSASVLGQRLSRGAEFEPNETWITAGVKSQSYHTTAFMRLTSAAISSVECTTDGKKCKFNWKDGEQSIYHAVWLRDNCHCPECWSSYEMKLLLDVKELQGDLRIRSVKVEEGTEKTMVHFCWSYGEQKKEHRGCIELQWLKDNSYSVSKLQDLQKHCQPSLNAIKSVPEISYADIMNEEETLWKWLKTLNECGMCCVTDIPTNLGEIKTLAKIAGGVQENYFGKTFEIISEENPNDIGSTSVALGLHMDLQYYESPPGLQLLQCLRFDDCVEGGESTLLDAFLVVEEIKRRFPQHFKTLTDVPATFYRLFTDRKIPVALKYQKPHIILSSSGKVSAINWTLHSQGPLQVPEEDVERYYEAFCLLGRMFEESDLRIHYRLKPGQAVTINNRRILHGRNSYKLNGGTRHLEGCYVSSDAFKSKVRLLAAKYEPNYYVKNVFNQDYGL